MAQPRFVRMDDRIRNPCKVFVGGIGQSTVESTLVAHFSRYGDVAECVIVYDRRTGRSRGFGFVSFIRTEDVEMVLHDKHKIDDVLVECRIALPRDEARGTAPYDALYMPNKIFVGGIPESFEEEAFLQFFGQFGTVIDVSLAYDKKNHRPRGFGFIVYESIESVDKAIGHHIIKGRMVEAKRAVPREMPPFRQRAINTGQQLGNIHKHLLNLENTEQPKRGISGTEMFGCLTSDNPSLDDLNKLNAIANGSLNSSLSTPTARSQNTGHQSTYPMSYIQPYDNMYNNYPYNSFPYLMDNGRRAQEDDYIMQPNYPMLYMTGDQQPKMYDFKYRNLREDGLGKHQDSSNYDYPKDPAVLYLDDYNYSPYMLDNQQVPMGGRESHQPRSLRSSSQHHDDQYGKNYIYDRFLSRHPFDDIPPSPSFSDAGDMPWLANHETTLKQTLNMNTRLVAVPTSVTSSPLHASVYPPISPNHNPVYVSPMEELNYTENVSLDIVENDNLYSTPRDHKQSYISHKNRNIENTHKEDPHTSTGPPSLPPTTSCITTPQPTHICKSDGVKDLNETTNSTIIDTPNNMDSFEDDVTVWRRCATEDIKSSVYENI